MDSGWFERKTFWHPAGVRSQPYDEPVVFAMLRPLATLRQPFGLLIRKSFSAKTARAVNQNDFGRTSMKKIIIILAAAITLAVVGFITPEISPVSAKAVSGAPQATQEKPLSEAQVGNLLDKLKEGLPELIADEKAVEAIFEKWDAHEDLPGKTQYQILNILLKDVNSVIRNADASRKIWDEWHAQLAMNTDKNDSPELKEIKAQLAHMFAEIQQRARQRAEFWKQIFDMLAMGGDQDYDAEAVAGFYLMNEGANLSDAFFVAGEGIIAYQRYLKRDATANESQQIQDLFMKTVLCEKQQNCAALQQGMKERAVKRFMALEAAKNFITLFAVLSDPKNQTMDKLLGAFIGELHEEYQAMGEYDPYKIEAECLKNGGDELSCFQTTFFGVAGYSIFGKQAESGPKIEPKSLDLFNRWQKERFTHFQCIDGDCKKGMEFKPGMELKTKPPSVLAQTKPEQPLSSEAAAALVQELVDGLADVMQDQGQFDAITDKWEARGDLAGNTRTQILNLLFADVRSIIKDKETQDRIWSSWTGKG
jgi:hypothetical protein